MPKKYGDKLELGGDPDKPITFVLSNADARL